MISISNTRQIIWKKRLASENEHFEKRQLVEKEIQEEEANQTGSILSKNDIEAEKQIAPQVDSKQQDINGSYKTNSVLVGSAIKPKKRTYDVTARV